MNGKIPQTITTLDIAEMLEVRHSDILAKLNGNKRSKGIIKVLSERNIPSADFFQESSYTDEQGKERPCYKVTKLGCDFLANKFNGEKGIVFTARYVKRFADMEKALQQPRPTLHRKETYLLKNSPTWFQRNNEKMKMICKYFYWDRKHLYHKILQEISDIYNLTNIEDLYISDYGHSPYYKMELVEYFQPLQELADSYIDHLAGPIKDEQW